MADGQGVIEREPRLRYDDEDFLAMVASERQNAVGMDLGDELEGDRERALDYYKGNMDDIPLLPNRSKAVHTVVSDTLMQALPDLVEILLGGEDVGAFKPIGEEDEEAAKQETEVVNNVITNENDGFGIIHDYVHDALLMKTGVLHAWIERNEKYEEETLKGQTAMALQMLQQQPEQSEVLQVVPAGEDPMVGPLYDVTVGRPRTNVCVKIKSHPPEDFAVARDTVNLRDATYAVARERPRAQALKQMGFDPDKVDEMVTWNAAADQQLDQARDTAGEHDEPRGASDVVRDLRQVMIHIHVLRVDADGDGVPEIWRIITDDKEALLLDKEKLECVPFCAGTPYRQPHRFYGRSLADLTMELQRIMTALLRLHLDGGFFALNARHEVDLSKANEHTLNDYMNNTPGFPVRVRQGGAVTPLNSTKSDFNALESLEYMATVTETRTGVTRNAQGLNPDTLHDTARGAEQLMSNAQKRLRLIARTLAETGIKDLFLLVHSLLRTSGADRPMAMRLRNKWVQVDPTQWGERKDFTVEIGTGAGGREMDLQLATMIGGLMDKIVEGQASGAISPPVVTPKNIFSFADWVRERGGVKKTTFFTDPESEDGQKLAEAAQQAQQPDPKVMEAEAKIKLQEQAQAHSEQIGAREQDRKDGEAMQTLERKRAEAELADRLANDRAAAEAELADRKAQQELELALRKQDQEFELAKRQQDMEFDLKSQQIEKDRELGHRNADVKAEIAGGKGEDGGLPDNRPGGDLSE